MIKKEHFSKENVTAKTEKVLERVNHLARESHKRQVTIKDHKHRHLITFPMSLGIAAAVIVPIVAGIGLAAFLINDWMVDVHKREEELE